MPLRMRPILLFVDLPLQSIFDNEVAWPFSGARTVRLEFFRCALQSPDFEPIALVEAGDKAAIQMFVSKHSGRCRMMTLDELCATDLGPDVVVHTLNADLRRGVYLRAMLGQHNWPVAGLTHDLSDPEIYDQLLVAYAGGLQPFDSITCASVAAERALIAQIEALRAVFSRPLPAIGLPVIPHGIDLSEVRPTSRPQSRRKIGLDDNDYGFLYFGRICDLTKADLLGLVHVFCDTFRSRREVKLIIAGSVPSGTGEEYLVRLANAISMEAATHQVTLVANPNEQLKTTLYSAVDAFVSPANSFQESFGISLLEAMAYSLPVVASNWNGYRDIVLDGQTGFLFDTGLKAEELSSRFSFAFPSRVSVLDSISKVVHLDFAQCARSMNYLERNRQAGSDMGAKGRQRVRERFNWRSLMASHTAMWLDAIARSKGSTVDKKGVKLFPDLLNVFRHHASRID